jgi:simple sugar transport system ATP-binding protein
MTDDLLRMESIVKTFPGVIANDHVDLTVRRGEIHGLLGENGAGKSTLMKVLYGLYTPDEGTIRLDGTPLRLDKPQDAMDAGIGMVHQHFKLIPRLTVTENVVLGSREPAASFRKENVGDGLLAGLRTSAPVQAVASRFSLGLDRPKRRIRTLADQYGFNIDVSAPVRELDVGQRQRVEILKALYRDADLLILDHPTAVLTPVEAERLFETLERLVDDGLSVILITHKLKEVESVTDRVTVLREGADIGTVDTADVGRAELARMMVGRDVLFEIEKPNTTVGDPVLEASSISAADDRGIEKLSGVNLEVSAGEVVGVAGVSGNGQTQLAETVAGVRDPTAGTIEIRGREMSEASPDEFIEQGVSFVPEDRHENGCAGGLSVMHNAAMKDFRDDQFGDSVLFDYGSVGEYASRLVDDFDVRGVSDVTDNCADDLSGGNLQKLILARELARDPDLLVANQPTRGIDVGAIEFVRERLLERRDQGTGVLLFSENLDELFDLSDRLLVMYEGEIVLRTTPEETNKKRLSVEMNGGGSKRVSVPDDPPEAATRRAADGGRSDR